MSLLQKYLAPRACTLQACVTQYDAAVHVQDRCAVPLTLEDGAAECACCGGQWHYTWEITPVPERDDAVICACASR